MYFTHILNTSPITFIIQLSIGADVMKDRRTKDILFDQVYSPCSHS